MTISVAGPSIAFALAAIVGGIAAIRWARRDQVNDAWGAAMFALAMGIAAVVSELGRWIG